MTCGAQLGFDPLVIKAKSQRCASGMLLFLGSAALSALAAHAVLVMLWHALPWTRAKPLPDFLVFPVPELLLASLLVLPLAMASTVLILQDSVGSRVLGALAMALLLGYLALVAAVLLGVSARRELLGLRYVEHPAAQRGSGAQRGAEAAPPTAADEPPEAPDATLDVEGTAAGGSQQQKSRLAASGNSLARSLVLLRVTPPHAAGHWERPDVVLQQELRRAYQGELPGSQWQANGD
jgi:hypothetical protein